MYKLGKYVDEINQYLRDGKSYREIANMYNVTGAAIGWYARKYKLRRIDLGLPGAKPGSRPKYTRHPERKKIPLRKSYKVKLGYILAWDESERRYKYEHRIIMEKYLGRKLTKDEIVHHRNHIRDDNRIENLCIIPKKTHHLTRRKPTCEDCKLVKEIRLLRLQIKLLSEKLGLEHGFDKSDSFSLLY